LVSRTYLEGVKKLSVKTGDDGLFRVGIDDDVFVVDSFDFYKMRAGIEGENGKLNIYPLKTVTCQYIENEETGDLKVRCEGDD